MSRVIWDFLCFNAIVFLYCCIDNESFQHLLSGYSTLGAHSHHYCHSYHIIQPVIQIYIHQLFTLMSAALTLYKTLQKTVIAAATAAPRLPSLPTTSTKTKVAAPFVTAGYQM